MTQTKQRPQPDPGSPNTLPQDVSASSSTPSRPITESNSDNDTSEKPVREKLKKTSLASMSNHILGRQERAARANEEKSEPGHMHRDSSPEKDTEKKRVEPRGRPVKKRSFDDLDTPEADGNEAGREHATKPNANGHLRKRSRDVRVGETPKENRRPLLAGTPVREESEDVANGVETSEACNNGPNNTVDSLSPVNGTPPLVEREQAKQAQDIDESIKRVSEKVQQNDVTNAGNEPADQEMRDSASSPRKKRSRDQFDAEADREQKIPATEEARAHRRSDELERGEGSVVRSLSPISPERPGVPRTGPVMVDEEMSMAGAHAGVEKQQVGFTAGP